MYFTFVILLYFSNCVQFTSCFVVCTVHRAALQVVCLPFRAKPCYAKVPAPTGSEEVPIAFKFLAQPAGAVQVPKSFSQRCREFLAATSLCKSSFSAESSNTWKSHSQRILHSLTMSVLLMIMMMMMMRMMSQSDEDMSVGTGGGGGDRSNLRLSEPLSVAMTLSLQHCKVYSIQCIYWTNLHRTACSIRCYDPPLSPALHVHCVLSYRCTSYTYTIVMDVFDGVLVKFVKVYCDRTQVQ